jgi:hypothetical protein
MGTVSMSAWEIEKREYVKRLRDHAASLRRMAKALEISGPDVIALADDLDRQAQVLEHRLAGMTPAARQRA